MTEKTTLRLLKIAMCLGLSLILFGHYLISYVRLPESHGVTGIIICALCIAVGIILSLPTKIYLTLLLMRKEQMASSDTSSQND